MGMVALTNRMPVRLVTFFSVPWISMLR